MSAPDETLLSLNKTLAALRQQLRRYVLIEGIAFVVAVLCLGFWLTFGLDELHFAARKLELPRWLRIAATMSIVAIAISVLMTWIIGRLWTNQGRKMLALVLEKRFPQLDDRLVAAIELEDSPQTKASPFAQMMWKRTAQQAQEALQSINLKDVFNPRPLRQAVLVAAVLLSSILVLATANAASVKRWTSAFVLGQNDYWEPYRRSELNVRVIAEPGKRVKTFDEEGIYRHPRGADLTLEALSVEGKRPPERATLSYHSFGASGSSRGSVPMSRSGDQIFRGTLPRVIEDQHLWITAGDYVNRQPFRIQVVDPPRLDRIELRCDYPTYTGLDAIEDTPVVIQSLQTALPMETRFTLVARANKPLVSGNIKTEQFELNFTANTQQTAPVLTVRDSQTSAARTIKVTRPGNWLSEDKLELRIPFIMTLNGAEQLASLPDEVSPPLPLAPVSPLQITLEDIDGVISLEPTRLTLTGITDLEPVVDVRLDGVSNVVTRLADLPIKGKITDDYGVRSAEFGFEILPAPDATPPEEGQKPDIRLVPLKAQPAGQREFAIGENGAGERHSLQPLDLKEGQRLLVSVYAEDADNLNGPHRSRSETFTLRVVPAEELLSRLYEKELNLRQRFEQIMTETRRVRDDLVQHEERTAEWVAAKAAMDTEKATSLFNSIDACARRSLHQVRGNHNECLAIEVAFGEIRSEMVNNRVDTPQLLERIDRGVVAPLHNINVSDYPALDGQIALTALATERSEDPALKLKTSREMVEQLLERMEKVLSEMQRRGNMIELIQQMEKLIELQKKQREATEQRKLDDLFEGLGIP